MSSLNLTEMAQVRLAHEAANLPAASEPSGGSPGSRQSVVLLDPRRIAPNPYATHLESTWQGRGFKRFCRQLKASGGNAQPILVRPASGGAPGIDYEIAYGHRRHRACLELGLPVRAIVGRKLDDEAMVVRMVTENSGYREASPYERGVRLNEAIKRGGFWSARELAEALGCNHSTISKLVKLARLPEAVTQAFSCPSDIRVNWGAGLEHALQVDQAGALRRAAEARSMGLAAEGVYEHILGPEGRGEPGANVPKVIRVHRGDKVVATITVPAANSSDIVINVSRGAASPAEIEKALRVLLAGSEGRDVQSP